MVVEHVPHRHPLRYQEKLDELLVKKRAVGQIGAVVERAENSSKNPQKDEKDTRFSKSFSVIVFCTSCIIFCTIHIITSRKLGLISCFLGQI